MKNLLKIQLLSHIQYVLTIATAMEFFPEYKDVLMVTLFVYAAVHCVSMIAAAMEYNRAIEDSQN